MPFKLYVDSRFRQDTGGSQSDAEFSIELPHPLKISGRAFVDVVLVPNTFYTIRGCKVVLHIQVQNLMMIPITMQMIFLNYIKNMIRLRICCY